MDSNCGDNHLYETLRDMKADLHEDILDLKKSLKEHIAHDERYWRKIDVQDGQITLLKVLLGGGTLTGFLYGLWQWMQDKVGLH